MKIVDLEQGSEEWLEFRRGKITGTRLGDIWTAKGYLKVDLVKTLADSGVEIPKGATMAQLKQMLTPESESSLWSQTWAAQQKKLGFYETIAERLGLPRDHEDRMDRGLRLEQEAADLFSQKTGKELETVGCWVSDVDDRIINSPDRPVKPKKKGIYTEAVEIKCLSPARHIQAVVENVVPEEFESQKVQYFVVNKHLETLYFLFYDPSIASVPYHVVKVTRKELGDKPELYLKFQVDQLREMDEIVERLAF